MRQMKDALPLLIVLLAIWASVPPHASEDMLVVEQDYKLFELNAKDGPNNKDIRQVLYITRDALAIDEFGDGGNKSPTETYIIDLKNQRIVNLDHLDKKVLLDESFAERRARITKRKKAVQSDLADADVGPRAKLSKMFRYMLDDDRAYTKTDGAPVKVADVECKSVKVADSNDAAFVAFEAAVHPELQMPYENSEVLFLLKIVSEKVAAFLKEQKLVSHVPMEMHLQLPDGGKLDTKVISVKKIKLEEFDHKSRTLGDPFKIPADYKIVPRAGAKTEPVTPEKRKEKAD